MLTREQFIEQMDVRLQCSKFGTTCAKPENALWAMERYKNIVCNYFICVKPMALHSSDNPQLKVDFFKWCDEYLAGQMLCYATDELNAEEWWGFENKDDITLWVLRWT